MQHSFPRTSICPARNGMEVQLYGLSGRLPGQAGRDTPSAGGKSAPVTLVVETVPLMLL